MSVSTEYGYFRPDDMIWRVGREAVMMIGGGRALLMQAAHPLTVAGVRDHSGYRENPWSRLERTMDAVWTIVYGAREDADRVGERVQALHESVRGTISEQMGPFPPGTSYAATDPELLIWVHATLVDTALLVYQSWIRPLSDDEQEAYYQDMKLMAQIFGTPEDAIPSTLGSFRAYMGERLASDEICVTDAAREVAETVLHPPLPLPLRPLMEMLNLVTAGLLPKRLRSEYGFRWDPARAALLTASRQWVRRVLLPLTPDLLRALGAARQAEGRAGVPFARLLPSI